MSSTPVWPGLVCPARGVARSLRRPGHRPLLTIAVAAWSVCSSSDTAARPVQCLDGKTHMHRGSPPSRAGGRQGRAARRRGGRTAALQCTVPQSLGGQTAGQGISSSARCRGVGMPLHQWPQPRSCPAGCRHAAPAAADAWAPPLAGGGGQLPAPQRSLRAGFHVLEPNWPFSTARAPTGGLLLPFAFCQPIFLHGAIPRSPSHRLDP